MVLLYIFATDYLNKVISYGKRRHHLQKKHFHSSLRELLHLSQWQLRLRKSQFSLYQPLKASTRIINQVNLAPLRQR